MNRKYDINYVEREFGKDGYKLLTSEYINTKQKLSYICPSGHKHSVSLNGWKKGDRCPYCSGLIKKTIEFVKDSFSKENYKLLTTEYINAHQQLKYICPAGHKCSMTWNNWKKGRRCPKCEDINFSLRFSGKNSWHWKNYSKTDLENISAYKSYVWQLTNNSYKRCKNTINPLDLPRGRNKYHLDHIYPIMCGFKNDVPPKIISHPINLQMLTEWKNISKKNTPGMPLNKLYTDYYKAKELDNEI